MNLRQNAFRPRRAHLAPSMCRRLQTPSARNPLREQHATGYAGTVPSQWPIIIPLQRPQNAHKCRQCMVMDWLVKFAQKASEYLVKASEVGRRAKGYLCAGARWAIARAIARAAAMPSAQDMPLRVRYPCATTVLAATCGLGGQPVASGQVPTDREQRPCRRAEDEAFKAMARNNERGGRTPGRPDELCRSHGATGVCCRTTRCGDPPLSSLSPLSSASPSPSLLRPIPLRLQMVRVNVAR